MDSPREIAMTLTAGARYAISCQGDPDLDPAWCEELEAHGLAWRDYDTMPEEHVFLRPTALGLAVRDVLNRRGTPKRPKESADA